MAEIAAGMVMELRGRTGLGMMECKKALTEAQGDMARAEELLRVKSGARASKAADRLAAEGVIGLHVSADAKLAALVEVNCETDFVAKNEEFKTFAVEVAQVVARDNPADITRLAASKIASAALRAEPRSVTSRPMYTVLASASWSTSRAAVRCWARISPCTSPHSSQLQWTAIRSLRM